MNKSEETKNKISETLKKNPITGKHIRKQVKCVETTEAWLSLKDFAEEKKISMGQASKILKKGIYKNQRYKFII